MIRAKFKVNSKTETDWGGVPITMSAVIDTPGEDSIFHKATPNGRLEMTILNPHASRYFVAGHKYYLDFSQLKSDIVDEIICKFRVGSRAETDWGGIIIKMYASKDGSDEDAVFGKATPAGQLEMAIMDPVIAMQFTPNSAFYIGFNDVTYPVVEIGG